MAKVIIAIHGLGNKPPKEQLQEWAKMAIYEGFDNLGIKAKLPKFEMVYWADLIFDRPQTRNEKDHNSPYYLDEVYTKAKKKYKIEHHEVRQKLLDLFKILVYRIFLKKDYQLRYAFVSQKLLHKYFHELEVYFTRDQDSDSEIKPHIREKIIKRLTDVLNKYTGYEVMLIAHSMGTIIAFDVLSFIAQDSKINTFVTMGAPLGAPFVISRIAKHSKRYYGQMRLQTPEAVKKHWYNFSDIMDKIALDYKLADDFEPNSHGVKCIDYIVNNTYHMNGIANPHKSYGYLRTPEFIKVLVDFINS